MKTLTCLDREKQVISVHISCRVIHPACYWKDSNSAGYHTTF